MHIRSIWIRRCQDVGVAIDIDYARRGDVSIAYQVVGDGPVDIILGVGLVSHLDLIWADPRAAEFLRSLAAMGRLLLFDKPGTGLSDPVVGPPTVEERAEDFLAVLDAAGSGRAVVVGFSEASTPALLFAATHPDRVEGLIPLSGGARLTTSPTYLPEIEPVMEGVMWRELWRACDHWGDGHFLMELSPFVRRSAVYRRLAPSIERSCASPGMARAMIRAMRSYDVTHVLETIRTPTLIIHRTDEWVPVQNSRYLAEHIIGSQYTELPGDEHMVFFDSDGPLAAIGEFVGGSKPVRSGRDRRLATVLFSDIVDSTTSAAELGDEKWCALLAQHDRSVADEIDRHDGRLVKRLGDGVLASFDRPMLAIRCGLALRDRAADLGISLRIGVHTGECEVVADDLAGIAVHVGSRIASLAQTNEVLVSSTVRDLVFGSGVEFAERGGHELKGVPGTWSVYAVVDDKSRDQRPVQQASPEEAALTPGPDVALRPVDKAILRVASHAPGLTRRALAISGRVRSRRT